MKEEGYLTAQEKERAVLVGVNFPHSPWSLDSSLDELASLVDTDGAEVVACITQNLDAPNPRTFIGSGKVKEVEAALTAFHAKLVVFDDELTPSQQSNLERSFARDVKVIDRTALILDIFALHAHTREGRLQVRLSQNQYLYPRLRGMWAHLASNRMGGGVGSRFGEGESQLEVDRRIVRKRISSIRRELKHLDSVRRVQRSERQKSGIFKVALAGYTNAGKSSLLNALTDADVLSYDKLFATLDSKTKQLTLPEGRQITLTDTVGFIQKLPTTLIESFKSTLDEIREADLILHIVDASSDVKDEQMKTVEDVLAQVEASEIPCMLVFNKIDLLSAETKAALASRYPEAAFISAQTQEGIDLLVRRIANAAASHDRKIEVLIPYERGDLVSLAHENCRIMREIHTEKGTELSLLVPQSYFAYFENFQITTPNEN
ncbi:MAG: GTPase HflX [Eggerthellaceae bacterium]|jgi:GTP-binding protein HflX